jgi:hypothetical protein
MDVQHVATDAKLVELWIRSFGSWHLLETFDSTAREFAGSSDPAGAAERAAWRAGRDLQRLSANISRFELRPAGEAGAPLDLSFHPIEQGVAACSITPLKRP